MTIEQLKADADSLFDHCKAHLRAHGTLAPMAHVLTGAGERSILVIDKWMGPTVHNKESFSQRIRSYLIDNNAQSILFASDAWITSDKPGFVHKRMAITLTAEAPGIKLVWIQFYRTNGKSVIWEERIEGEPETMSGRFMGFFE
jgi:hypothetical protein